MKNLFKLLLFFITLNIAAQIERADSIMAAEYKIRSIEANTKYSDFGATFMGDKLVFSSTRPKPGIVKRTWRGNNQPFLDLYVGDLKENGQIENVRPFSKEVNTKYHDAFVSFTKDLKHVYFTSNDKVNRRIKSKSVKLFKAKNGADGKWTDLENLPFNSDGYDAGHPFITKDGSRIYFVSNMPGTQGDKDIFYVDIKKGFYSAPVNLGPTINSPKKEYTPFVDGNLIYFASNREGGLGGFDIYVTKLDGSLQEPINLGPSINSKADDFSFIINSEKLQGYLSSNRAGGKGDDDIYTFVQTTPMKICDQSVTGVVKDKVTLQPVTNAAVTLRDANGNRIRTVTTLANGVFKFGLDCAINYTIEVTKNGFFDFSTAMETTNSNGFKHDKEILIEEKEFITKNGVEMLNITDIDFELNRADIKEVSKNPLGKVVRIMKKYPNMVIAFGAHTDSRGPDGLNLSLSQRRAVKVIQFLMDQGVASERITGKGYGETRLLNECGNNVKCTDAQHRVNKRTEFVVVKK